MRYEHSASTIHRTNNKANRGPTCSTKRGEIHNKILLSHFQKYPSTMQGNSKITSNHSSLPNHVKCKDLAHIRQKSRSMDTVKKLFDRF